MKLLKKIHKKEDKKAQFNSLRAQQKANVDQEAEPFAWKEFFEEAYNMGMKVDLNALSRTYYKIVPPPMNVPEHGIFGVSLDDIMERQKKKHNENTVPNLVEQCVQYIMKYGLKEIGLFQHDSFDCEKIKSIRGLIDSGNGVDVHLHEHFKYIDVHTAAGLLKQYIREFPLPVIPSDVFDLLISSIKKGTDEMRKAINLLPRNSHNILEKIFYLLVQLDKHEVHNETTTSFLAESFGPTLMWRNAIVSLSDMSNTKDIAAAIIINYSVLFSKGTQVRPALGQIGYQAPSGLSKSASLSTLSFNSPQSSRSPSQSPSRAPLDHPTRDSVERPSPNYMLELYKNIKDSGDGQIDESDEEDEDEEEEDDYEEGERFRREMVKIGSLPVSQPASPVIAKRMSGGRIKRKEEELETEGITVQKEENREKGKAPTMLRKSMSEDLTNKHVKKGFSQFFKKIELKKKP